jgi:hypothetical protein
MSQHGSDVRLSFGRGDKLIVEGASLAELDATVFALQRTIGARCRSTLRWALPLAVK